MTNPTTEVLRHPFNPEPPEWTIGDPALCFDCGRAASDPAHLSDDIVNDRRVPFDSPNPTEAAQVAAEEIGRELPCAVPFGFTDRIARIISKHCDARASQWQDISTAPKGVSVLLGSPECEIVETGYAEFVDKLCTEGHVPTRWQALPSPPDTQYQE